MKTYRDLVIQIRKELEWFADNFKKEISANVYEGLWNEIRVRAEVK